MKDEAERIAASLTEAARPNDELLDILGRPNFTCIEMATLLRRGGYEIPKKAENEQAEVIYFLLRHYAADPSNWRANANAEFRRFLERSHD